VQAWLNSNFLWTQFLVCGAAIVLAGVKLSRFGHIMGEKLNIGSTWIGLVLLAAVTSLPEMITSCTAGAIGAPDMAVGNLFGSNLINLAILGLLGLMMPRLAKWDEKGARHLLSCCLNLLILSVALLAIVIHKTASLKALFEGQNVREPPIGASSIVIFAIYLLSMFLIFVHEKAENAAEAHAKITASKMTASLSYQNESLSGVCVKFTVCAAIIVAAGWRLVVLGNILAEIPIDILGTRLVLGQSIIGTFFLAVATSLPEFAVCYAAVKMGAADMAIGNVFGSNIFNIATIPLADIFFTKGPILAHVSGIHLITGLIVILASVVFILGSSYRGLFVGFRQLPVCATIVALWLGGWLLIFILNSQV